MGLTYKHTYDIGKILRFFSDLQNLPITDTINEHCKQRMFETKRDSMANRKRRILSLYLILDFSFV